MKKFKKILLPLVVMMLFGLMFSVENTKTTKEDYYAKITYYGFYKKWGISANSVDIKNNTEMKNDYENTQKAIINAWLKK